MRGRRKWTEAHGIRLAQLRIRAGILDRKKLALLVGENPARIYRWEAAWGKPDEAQIRRLARVLGVDPREIAA